MAMIFEGRWFTSIGFIQAIAVAFEHEQNFQKGPERATEKRFLKIVF
jgi:hypothetical protein